MTVGELIDQLQKLDKDLPVVFGAPAVLIERPTVGVLEFIRYRSQLDITKIRLFAVPSFAKEKIQKSANSNSESLLVGEVFKAAAIF